jgi:hypothetical protein
MNNKEIDIVRTFSDSVENSIRDVLGKTPFLFDNILFENRKYIYHIFAAYSIIQVLAQDMGLKTGRKQRDLVHRYKTLQFILFYSTAISIMPKENELEALVGCGLYFIMKYYYSEGETSDVCFEKI